jgi:aminoglycoside phosphotransferase family enzyme
MSSRCGKLPQQYRIDNMFMLGKVRLETIKRLTNSLVKFHCTTRTNTKIKNFGKPKFVKMKISENFKTLTKLATIDPNSILMWTIMNMASIMGFIDMTTLDPVCCSALFRLT